MQSTKKWVLVDLTESHNGNGINFDARSSPAPVYTIGYQCLFSFGANMLFDNILTKSRANQEQRRHKHESKKGLNVNRQVRLALASGWHMIR